MWLFCTEMTLDGETANTIPLTRWLIVLLIISHGKLRCLHSFLVYQGALGCSLRQNPINKTLRWAVIQQTWRYVFFWGCQLWRVKDLVSSDSWWVPELGESYGFTLLFILSYLGKPRWCMRAVTYQGCEFSLQWVYLIATFATVWLNVGTRRRVV